MSGSFAHIASHIKDKIQYIYPYFFLSFLLLFSPFR